MRLRQNTSHGSCQTDQAVTDCVTSVCQACYDNANIASASLTCCEQYGIIMLGYYAMWFASTYR